MSLTELKALAADYDNQCIGQADNEVTKLVLTPLIDTLEKTKLAITSLKARVKALEDA